MTRLWRVMTLALGLVAATACGAGDAEDTEAGATTTTMAAEGTTADAEGADLDAVLLMAGDLPTGWSEVPTSPEGGASCLDALFGSGAPFDPSSAVTASFGASEAGPFLSAWVVGEAADVVLADVDDILVACDGSTGPSGFTTTIDPTPVAGLPADSLSVHGADENPAGSRIDYVIAGAGTDSVTVLVFAATSIGQVDDVVVAMAIDAMLRRANGDS